MRVVWLCLALGVAACGTADGEGNGSTGHAGSGPRSTDVVTVDCPEKPPDPSRVRVMVVDRGFDLRHPVFAGKIAGCYQIACPEDSPSFTTLPGETDDEAAARLIASLSSPTRECTVTPGMSISVDSYLDTRSAADRDEWNDAVLGKRLVSADSKLDADTLLLALNGITDAAYLDPLNPTAPTDDTAEFVYHGTATAGAIAYDNDVDIVVVERALATSLNADDFTCYEQSDIDTQLRLLHREDVRAANKNAPPSGLEAALADLRRRHGIRLENHSYGPPTTKSLSQALFDKDCPVARLDQYTAALGELDAEREAYLRASGALDGADPLIFESAGNDAEEIDSAGDYIDCTPDRAARLLVGSYSLYRGQGAASSFSNDGECVDLYALGEDVILPAPNGFYVPLSGTSFSAPLALRFASTLAKDVADDAELRDRVLAARDANRFLPPSTMPVELAFYDTRPATSRAPLGMLSALACGTPRLRGCR